MRSWSRDGIGVFQAEVLQMGGTVVRVEVSSKMNGNPPCKLFISGYPRNIADRLRCT